MFHDRIHTADAEMPGTDELAAFADFLRERRGVIALLATLPVARTKTVSAWAYRIRQAKRDMAVFSPAGHFESVVVTVFGQTHVYVRYVGERRH